MSENKVSVIDEPAGLDNDDLDTNVHSRALIRFIEKTGTPITIGIQGEWGSGKTSLLNTIHHHFDKTNREVKQIWVNAWEHSLLCKPEESLIKIVNEIIIELINSDTDKARVEKIKGGVKQIFSGALRIGASVTLGKDAADVAGELIRASDVNISSLRNQLKNLVCDIAERDTNPYKKILIYVDDLDRIEPKNAVIILELLKNIFSIPNSVFLLAIDYQVVVKGLEGKFGKHTDENEWEFRAFFDKIIQLPFMMPMGQYNIGKYVNKLLVEVGFIREDMSPKAIREVVLRTIGGNPRSIKRLVNSVSLIQIFSEELLREEGEDEDGVDLSPEDEKFLIFSIICMQIAYPSIYEVLSENPKFLSWDDGLASQQTNRSEEKDAAFKGDFERAQKTKDFDEEWEKALFRICYAKPRIRKHATNISKFFSYIKDEFFKGRDDEFIEEAVIKALSQTTVTSVTSTQQAQMVLPERQGPYKRRYLQGLDQWILQYKEEKLSDELLSCARELHQYLSKKGDEIEFSFTGSFTAKINKHKFFGLWGERKKGKEFLNLKVLKHYKRDYKFPKSDGIVIMRLKPFTEESPSQKGEARASEWIQLEFNAKQYQKTKPLLFSMIEESCDMAKNHWDKRLRINNEEKTFLADGKEINWEDDPKQYLELCMKYINPNHTYDPVVAEKIV